MPETLNKFKLDAVIHKDTAQLKMSKGLQGSKPKPGSAYPNQDAPSRVLVERVIKGIKRI